MRIGIIGYGRIQTAGRTGEEREQDPELERYYREVQEAIAGTVEGNTDFAGADIGFDEEWQGRGSEEDTEAFLGDLRFCRLFVFFCILPVFQIHSATPPSLFPY